MAVAKNKENMTAGLGNNTVPAGYNQPSFGLGTAVQIGSPNPEAQLAAASAAVTPNGIDPLNKGYQLGGANDPLAEFEPAIDNPSGMSIGKGSPPAPISSPGFPPMASHSFNEDDDFMGEGITPFPEEIPIGEDGLFGEEDADQVFEDADAVPAFEDISDDPSLASLSVDADGVIQPVVIPDEIVVDSELGEIPDVALPFEEPILDITDEDVDVAIPDNVFENDGMPEAVPVVESFRLPENQNVVVFKGDQIFMLGHVREEFTPRFAECVFSRALKSLAESKNLQGKFLKFGQKHEKVAVVGRSLLVEVSRDWRLPGTNVIFEAHDLLQIVSARPVQEADETNEAEDKKGEGASKKDGGGKKEDEDKIEAEKAKKEYYLAKRRWLEAKKKRAEDDGDEEEEGDEDAAEKAEKKAKKERARREAAMLERQRTGGWV
jgi:hypothetical protein